MVSSPLSHRGRADLIKALVSVHQFGGFLKPTQLSPLYTCYLYVCLYVYACVHVCVCACVVQPQVYSVHSTDAEMFREKGHGRKNTRNVAP